MGNSCDKDTSAKPSGADTHKGGHCIVLNVYNLQKQKEEKEKSINGMLGFGFYHSGIEVFGKEWSFGGNPAADDQQPGIFASYPKTVLPKSQFFESVVLGVLPSFISERDVMSVLSTMHKDWRAVTYHLLQHNCNHFTESFREALMAQLPVTSTGKRAGTQKEGGHMKLKEIPSYVNRAARVADFFVPEVLYQKMMAAVPQSNGQGAQQTTAGPSPNSGARPGTNGREYQAGAQQRQGDDGETDLAEYHIPKEREELEGKTVRQLKTMMWVNGVSAAGCLEKKDLVDRIVEFQKQRNKPKQ